MMMVRSRWVWLLMLVFAAAAGGKDENFSVDIVPGWGSYYRPMEWTPLYVTLQSRLSTPFAGKLIISAAQDGLNTLIIEHEVVLTPGQPTYVPLVTKFAYGLENLRVRLVSRDNGVVWRADYQLYDPTLPIGNLTEVEGDDFFIGVIGRQQMGVATLKDTLHCQRGDVVVGGVIAGNMLTRYAPWDWTGYEALDVLLLFDPDWSELNTEQCEAMRQWVSKGGKLLVVLGSHPMPLGHPLRVWLPVSFENMTDIEPDWAHLADLSLDHTDDVKTSCYHLTPRQADDTFMVNNTCVYAAGPVGFGRVAVLGFNPGNLGPKQVAVAGQFWLGRLRPLLKPPLIEGQTSKAAQTITELERSLAAATEEYQDKGQHHYPFQTSIDLQAANRVMEHLFTIPELRPLSLGWVIMMLLLLAVLLGPVDYFFLKRRDKLPLTWLTMTGWIALFTFAAYYGVEALRGGDLQVRAVTMIDACEDTPEVWRTTYAGIFAPHSDDYRLDSLGEKEWWSGIAPSEHEIFYHRQNNNAIRNIGCVQHDGGNLPVSLPINIWSMQTLIRENQLNRVPLRVSVDRREKHVAVTITNLADELIRRGYVLFDNQQAMDITAVAPGERKVFKGELKWTSNHNWLVTGNQNHNSIGIHLHSDVSSNLSVATGFAQGTFSRTAGILRGLERGRALVLVEYADAPLDFAVADKDFKTDHSCWCRLLVTPGLIEEELINDPNQRIDKEIR